MKNEACFVPVFYNCFLFSKTRRIRKTGITLLVPILILFVFSKIVLNNDFQNQEPNRQHCNEWIRYPSEEATPKELKRENSKPVNT